MNLAMALLCLMIIDKYKTIKYLYQVTGPLHSVVLSQLCSFEFMTPGALLPIPFNRYRALKTQCSCPRILSALRYVFHFQMALQVKAVFIDVQPIFFPLYLFQVLWPLCEVNLEFKHVCLSPTVKKVLDEVYSPASHMIGTNSAKRTSVEHLAIS
jgi:hypothetical protein